MFRHNLFTQELSEGHSSVDSHPTVIGPGVGGGGGGVTGGNVGLGLGCSASGGSPGLAGSVTGVMETSSFGGRISDIGERVDGGLSVSKALHPRVGSPVVPGGQLHTGR